MDETTQPFIGIDPDDTAQVQVRGATVTIGAIDQGVWSRINAEAQLAHEGAKRRAIRRLASEGLDPEELAEGGTAVSRLQLEAYMDPGFREQHFNVQCEAVRHAVRAHDGLLKRDGSAISCERVPLKQAFGECTVLSEATLRVYRANPVLVEALWMPIFRMQTLGEAEKKA